MLPDMQRLFKICSAGDWAAAARAGHYHGSAVDQRDGFIHLSAGDQVRETAARHFAGQEGLVLVAFDGTALAHLKWESARGAALFPHVYGAIPANAALWVKDLPLENGRHRFPDDIPA